MALRVVAWALLAGWCLLLAALELRRVGSGRLSEGRVIYLFATLAMQLTLGITATITSNRLLTGVFFASVLGVWVAACSRTYDVRVRRGEPNPPQARTKDTAT